MRVLCMFEHLHAKPMKIHSTDQDRKCQGHQEAVIPVVIKQIKTSLDLRKRKRKRKKAKRSS